MPGIHDAFDIAYRAGHLIGQGLAASAITGQGAPLLEAVGTVLQSCDELAAQGEGVLAKILREKALAALHEDPEQTIDGTVSDASREDLQLAAPPAPEGARVVEHGGRFWASCACDWRGVASDDRARAEADAQRHDALDAWCYLRGRRVEKAAVKMAAELGISEEEAGRRVLDELRASAPA